MTGLLRVFANGVHIGWMRAELAPRDGKPFYASLRTGSQAFPTPDGLPVYAGASRCWGTGVKGVEVTVEERSDG